MKINTYYKSHAINKDGTFIERSGLSSQLNAFNQGLIIGKPAATTNSPTQHRRSDYNSHQNNKFQKPITKFDPALLKSMKRELRGK